MKICPKCKNEKPLRDFYKRKDGGVGYQTFCSSCAKKNSSKKQNHRLEIIKRATNNGKCWWVYQWIVGNTYYHRKKKAR